MAHHSDFSVRIVTCDSYMAKPVEGLDSLCLATVKDRSFRVPILRIFGSTPAGQTVCMHVHRVFPYIYVPYDGSAPADKYLDSFANNLDQALNNYYSESRTTHSGDSNSEFNASSRQHVFKLSIVKGVPFYGFYQNELMFIKIYFYNPQSVKSATKLLQSGGIFGKSFQPYEAHIPYILQFFMDFNLQGMNFLNASSCQFRRRSLIVEPYERTQFRNSLPSDRSQSLSGTTYHVPNSNLFVSSSEHLQNNIPRMTICELEVDVIADDILNREEIEVKVGTNPGLESIWREENQRRAWRGLSPLDGLVASQERMEYTSSKSEQFYSRKLESKLTNVSLRSTSILEEVLETVADIVDDVEVMNRESLLFGVSDATIIDYSDNIQNSFFLDRHNENVTDQSSYGDKKLLNTTRVINLPVVEEEQNDDLLEILADLARAAEAEAETDTETLPDLNTCLEQDERDAVDMNKSLIDLDDCEDLLDIQGNKYVPQHVHPDLREEQWIPRSSSSINFQENDMEDLFAACGDTSSKIDSKRSKSSRIKDNSDQILGSPLGTSTPFQRPTIKLPIGNQKRVKFAADVEEKVVLSQRSHGKLILTPAEPFPSYESVCETAHLYGMSRHVGHSTFISNIYELAREPLMDTTTKCQSKDNLPYQQLQEFSSNCIPFNSADYFQEGIKFVEGSYSDLRKKVKLISSIEPSKKNKSKTSQLSRKTKIANPVLRNTGQSWKVVLTPVIPFPNLTHAVRMQKKLDAIPKDDEKFVPLINDDSFAPIKTASPQPFCSVLQARKNRPFKKFLGKAINLDLSPRTKPNMSVPRNSNPLIFHEAENILVMNLELHVDVPNSYSADPKHHAIRFLCFTLMSDTGDSTADGCSFCIYLDENCALESRRRDLEKDVNRFSSWVISRVTVKSLTVEFVSSEEELLHVFYNKVRSLDPDILVGYEIQMTSWGYLIERADLYGLEMLKLLSRLLKPSSFRAKRKVPNAVAVWEARKMSEIHIVGRIVLNLWRLIKQEVTLNIYSFENVVFRVLKHRLFLYPNDLLTQWFRDEVGSITRWKAMEYLILKSTLTISLLCKIDLIRQTAEFSRVFGIQFYDTLTRGSQFRVESVMLRLAKSFNFLPVTPNSEQLMQMGAPECLPLIFEPESRFYYDPVVVLDFQSLYPSMMIAYNYCFSTCLGQVDSLGKDDYFKFGCTAYHVPPYLLKKHLADLNFAPNGVAFVRETVRKGILPRMLEEILNTRIMVKKSMTEYKDDPILKKLLHVRQLGLKLIANVTYGYTSASFSGRMPCVEIGDSIVSKARETLERAIKFVEGHPKWNARIVYGDTDSMFVVLRGRSKEEAFRIGREIEKAITDMNPKPVKLKFEKVYLPCVLQTKKRYCGYMYENEDQIEPVFDAKGIETVRRDGCELISKTLEQVVRLLFKPNIDVAQLRSFVEQTFADVLSGNVNMKQFIFAKEYRGRKFYKPGARIPALEIAKKATKNDPRAEPRAGERVPYIITYGNPKETLINLVRQPYEIFQNPSLRPHGYYYCSRQLVPVLNRVLLLLSLDCKNWLFEVMERLLLNGTYSALENLSTDLMYFRKFCSEALLLPGNPLLNDTHSQAGNELERAVTFQSTISQLERKSHLLTQMCKYCMGTTGPTVECVSFDCPVIFQQYQTCDRRCRLLIANNLSVSTEASENQ